MKIRDWREFYDTIVIVPGYGEPVPKPTVAQLDRFEAEAKYRLPRSYREYILVFGPGELFADWKIAAPGYAGVADRWDLPQFHTAYSPAADDWWLGTFPAAEQNRIRRCLCFCNKYQDAFGWDPTEVCDPDSPEYAIYHMRDRQVVRVAGSFRQFVEDAADRMLSYSESEWDEEELGPRMAFSPATKDMAEPAAAPDRGGI